MVKLRFKVCSSEITYITYHTIIHYFCCFVMCSSNFKIWLSSHPKIRRFLDSFPLLFLLYFNLSSATWTLLLAHQSSEQALFVKLVLARNQGHLEAFLHLFYANGARVWNSHEHLFNTLQELFDSLLLFLVVLFSTHH